MEAIDSLCRESFEDWKKAHNTVYFLSLLTFFKCYNLELNFIEVYVMNLHKIAHDV